MKAIWKKFCWCLIALAFAAVVCYVVCYLEHSNRQAQADYDVAYQSTTVTVTVTNLTGNRRTNLKLPDWVGYLFLSNNSMTSYLKDIEQIASYQVDNRRSEYFKYDIVGIMYPTAQMLAPSKGGTVTFYPGYDASVLLEDDYVCLVPAWMEDEIGEDGIVTIPLECEDRDSGEEFMHSFQFQVIGTYDTMMDDADETMFYCPFQTVRAVYAKAGRDMAIDSITAVIIDNFEIEAFKEQAYRWFAPVDPSGEKKEFGLLGYKYFPYAIDVDTTTLDRISATLQTTLTINAFTAMLIFALSAGAGFFLGFLMIRSRKREIILMRTLGRANFSIYLSYAFEQMLCILAGAALGGLAFQWHPIERLGIFVGIYFVGLSAALILFLNSKLLTNVKEDE